MIGSGAASTRLWSVAILTWGLAATVAAVWGLPPPVRQVLVLGFLAICPGMAYMRVIRLDGVLTTWTLAFAVSIAIDSMVAAVMLYGGFWSPIAGLVAVVSLTAVGASLGWVRRPSTGWTPPASQDGMKKAPKP